MVELNKTGYMSNRGRQNVASYLVHHLLVDWRYGADYFAEKLLDYDEANNNFNWAYLAGVGHDSRDRIFNPETQKNRYDPDSSFTSFWLEKKNNK